LKVWHCAFREKNPSPLGSGWFGKYVVLAETYEEAEAKLRKYMRENEMELLVYIGKIEFVEEVDID